MTLRVDSWAPLHFYTNSRYLSSEHFGSDRLSVFSLPGTPSYHKVAIAGLKAYITIAFVLLVLLAPSRCGAQTAEAWLDYVANWSPIGQWSYEINPGLAKGFASPGWLDVYVASTATFQAFNWVSTEGDFEAHYTFDKATENVLELRPWLGLNFIWATYGEYLNVFYPALSFRLEERLLWYQTSGTQSTKTRARIRVSTRFPLNNQLLVPGTYYLLFLAENYIPIDSEAKEVSSDRRRFQAGLGYVVGSDLRIEFQYVLMRARNSYTNSFENTSNIFWLAVRNYL